MHIKLYIILLATYIALDIIGVISRQLDHPREATFFDFDDIRYTSRYIWKTSEPKYDSRLLATYESFHAKSTKKNYRTRPSSILMIFGILVDIYERTAEPKYGPAMASSYGETEALCLLSYDIMFV